MGMFNNLNNLSTAAGVVQSRRDAAKRGAEEYDAAQYQNRVLYALLLAQQETNRYLAALLSRS